MTTVKAVLDQARSLLGVRQYSPKHIQLVNDYNSVYPVPVGYLVNTDEDWCDVFITVIFDRENASHLIGRECGVERHIALFKGLGIWIEDGTITPQAGDIITWSWKDNSQPNNSWGIILVLLNRYRMVKFKRLKETLIVKYDVIHGRSLKGIFEDLLVQTTMDLYKHLMSLKKQ